MKTQKHLQILSLVLSFIALGISSTSVCARQNSAIDRFEPEIQAFEAQDKVHPPEPGRTLFLGSSTFTRWQTLEHDLAGINALNRGFGGSTIPEQIYYEKRLVGAYHPARIVFYAGTNDIAEGHSAKTVCDDFFKFVKAARKDAPNADIYFVSISVAPVRLALQPEFDAANQCILRGINSDAKLHFIDVRPEMLDANRQLKQEYFGPDHLHMNKDGYLVWTSVLKNALAK